MLATNLITVLPLQMATLLTRPVFQFCMGCLIRVVLNQNNYVFKPEIKMGGRYQESPFFLWARLRDSLDNKSKDLSCRYAFKRKIDMVLLRKEFCQIEYLSILRRAIGLSKCLE